MSAEKITSEIYSFLLRRAWKLKHKTTWQLNSRNCSVNVNEAWSNSLSWLTTQSENFIHVCIIQIHQLIQHFWLPFDPSLESNYQKSHVLNEITHAFRMQTAISKLGSKWKNIIPKPLHLGLVLNFPARSRCPAHPPPSRRRRGRRIHLFPGVKPKPKPLKTFLLNSLRWSSGLESPFRAAVIIDAGDKNLVHKSRAPTAVAGDAIIFCLPLAARGR